MSAIYANDIDPDDFPIPKKIDTEEYDIPPEQW